jgi:uncharacterized protein (TIGR03437 family)
MRAVHCRIVIRPFCLIAAAAMIFAQSTQSYTESVLANFGCSPSDCSASSYPSGKLLLASDGNFYGVTTGVGDFGIFKITPSGTLTSLYSFCKDPCPDGDRPTAGLVQGSDGNFYGTTSSGGSGNESYCTARGDTGCGTVFKITPSGTLTTLYNFCSQGDATCGDGFQPAAALMQGADGNFYGSTQYGGCPNATNPNGKACGTLFKVTPSGTLTTLYNFCAQPGCPDGAVPNSALILGNDGNFYGSASLGGLTQVYKTVGETVSTQGGGVFRITPAGAYTVLYEFCRQYNSANGVCLDGNGPTTPVQGSDGNFYGTTNHGGSGNGTAFRLTPAGKLTTLYNFCVPLTSTCPDGAGPHDLTLASDGNFYGTDSIGVNQGGTFFRLTPTGTLTTLYSFCAPGCATGSDPSDVTQGTDGNFYGTTVIGGGLVFKLTGPPTPLLTTGSAANGATYVSGGLVPGSWAQVKGTNLGTTTRIWASADFTGLGNNLPTNLSGTQVMVNGIPAAVYYISSGQVSFQVPSGVSGNVSVQVINNGVTSNTLTAATSTSSPGIFPVIENGVNYPAGVFLDGKYVGDPSVNSAFRNAVPGDVIELYATGLVTTPAGVLPAPQTMSGVTVTIGSTVIPADFAGLVAVGEFQINFTVPQSFANQPVGLYPISIQLASVSSPTTINSSPPGQLLIPIQP